MCFGGFDAPDAGEQQTYNYEASLLGVPPLGDLPVSRSGYVGPVSVETKGFSHNDKGEAVYQDTQLGFSPRGAAETLGYAFGAGHVVAGVRGAERGFELAQSLTNGGLDLGPGGAAVAAAPETGGLPSVTAEMTTGGATTKKDFSAALPLLGDDEVMRAMPWPDNGAASPTSRELHEGQTARGSAPGSSPNGRDRDIDHAARLRRVMLTASDPSGPLSLRRRVGAQQPRLLGE